MNVYEKFRVNPYHVGQYATWNIKGTSSAKDDKKGKEHAFSSECNKAYL